ncbi:TonB-dependent receptor plug domain-containing protein [Cellulophaga sp. L1A9]|uniref:TonB-dependent receptor plug domain-containing protein n=1 Tax=Cellulophaga sp. L1A9 TaxID=2686362 RepID=UPI00131B92CC|nr:TonB-dependent receptor plug domain-containing protein [Cellulophaga sp. L1A9]
MNERDLDKEFEILESIFRRTPNLTVQLLLFNIEITENEFIVTNSDWQNLKQKILRVKPDGATIYKGLEARIKNTTVYFFTDGNSVEQSPLIPIKKGNLLINSVPNRNEKVLTNSVLIGKGRLVDLGAILPERIRREGGEKSTSGKEIKGTVYVDNIPFSGVRIKIKGSEETFQTDDDGRFKIMAYPGDSILISSRIEKTMKIAPINYFNSHMDIFLNSNVTSLDEVIVTEKRVDLASNRMVDTAIGLQSKESVGYAVQSIGDEEISSIHTDISQSIQGKFSNVHIKSDRELTQFSTRPNNTLLGNKYGLVVIDGIPIETSDSSSGRSNPSDETFKGYKADASFIDPENIAKVTVLKGLAATNRYGALGNGGVLLITTKNAIYGKGNIKKENRALIKNNVYDSKLMLTDDKSSYTKALEGTKTLKEAYDKYLILRNYNESDTTFYLDAFSFFKDKDKVRAAQIISNLCEMEPFSESYLKIVEMALHYLDMEEVAETLNYRLKELNPFDLQPLFTEAKLKLVQGKKQEALTMFSNLENGETYNNLDIKPIQKSIERELKNLIFRDKLNLDVAGVKQKNFTNIRMNARIMAEWSDSKFEFLIQFVNPQNRYFNWEHASATGDERIQGEMESGYSMEEFEIYDDLKGEWTINVRYLGNLDSDNTLPLVLLFTVYENFGYPSQTEEKIILYFNGETTTKKVTSLKI